MAVAALWHAGRHRAASSSVLRGHSCGVQAARHLPVGRENDSNMRTLLGTASPRRSVVSGDPLPGFAIPEAEAHAEEDAYQSETHAHDDACHRVDVQLCLEFRKQAEHCKRQQSKKTYKCLGPPSIVYLVYFGT